MIDNYREGPPPGSIPHPDYPNMWLITTPLDEERAAYAKEQESKKAAANKAPKGMPQAQPSAPRPAQAGFSHGQVQRQGLINQPFGTHINGSQAQPHTQVQGNPMNSQHQAQVVRNGNGTDHYGSQALSNNSSQAQPHTQVQGNPTNGQHQAQVVDNGYETDDYDLQDLSDYSSPVQNGTAYAQVNAPQAQSNISRGQSQTRPSPYTTNTRFNTPQATNGTTKTHFNNPKVPNGTPKTQLSTPQVPNGTPKTQRTSPQVNSNEATPPKAVRTPRRARASLPTPSPVSSTDSGFSSPSAPQPRVAASFSCNLCVQSMPSTSLPKFTKERLEEHGRSLHRLDEHELESLFPTEGFSCQLCQQAMPNTKMPGMSKTELEKHGRQLHRLRDDEIEEYFGSAMSALGVENTKKEVAKYKSPALPAPKPARGRAASVTPRQDTSSPTFSASLTPRSRARTPQETDSKTDSKTDTAAKTPAKRKRKDKSENSTQGYGCHICAQGGNRVIPMNMAGLLKHGGEHHGYVEDDLQTFFLAAMSSLFSVQNREVNTNNLRGMLGENDNADIVSDARELASPNSSTATANPPKKRQARKKDTPSPQPSISNTPSQPMNSFNTQQGLGLTNMTFDQGGSYINTPTLPQGAQNQGLQNHVTPNHAQQPQLHGEQSSAAPSYTTFVGPNGLEQATYPNDTYGALSQGQQGVGTPAFGQAFSPNTTSGALPQGQQDFGTPAFGQAFPPNATSGALPQEQQGFGMPVFEQACYPNATYGAQPQEQQGFGMPVFGQASHPSNTHGAQLQEQQGFAAPTLAANTSESFSEFDLPSFDNQGLSDSLSFEWDDYGLNEDWFTVQSQPNLDNSAQEESSNTQNNQELDKSSADDKLEADLEAAFAEEDAMKEKDHQEPLDKSGANATEGNGKFPFPDPSSLPGEGGVAPTQTIDMEYDESTDTYRSTDGGVEVPSESWSLWGDLFGEDLDHFDVEFEYDEKKGEYVSHDGTYIKCPSGGA